MTKNQTTIRSVCIYCGSSPGKNEAFVVQATQLGEALASHNIRVVYGGGNRGLMGAVARGALQSGGAVMGIIPEFLQQKEQAGGTNTLPGMEVHVVADMHTRKQKMFEEADAFIAMPGGIGTLEELIEIMTWAQLGRHDKPIALLNTDNFWSPLIDLLHHMDGQGFIHNPERAKLVVASSVPELLAQMGLGLRKVDHV